MKRSAPARPVLGLLLIALLGLVVIAGAVVLVGPRLAEHRAGVAALPERAEAMARTAEVARVVEGLRGLARQIRHAPTGEVGTQARRQALARLRLVAGDAGLRASLTADEGAALTAAVGSLVALADRRARQRPRAAQIAERIARLDALAAEDRGASAATPRARLMRSLVTVLRQARHAEPPALAFLEARARRLAARAVAAPGLPLGVTRSGGGGSAWAALAAIEAALEVPRLRVAERADRARTARLWHAADDALSGVADALTGRVAAPLWSGAEALAGMEARLTAALLAVLAAAGALWVWGLMLGLAGHAVPLGRLAARARAITPAGPASGGLAGGRAWGALDGALTLARDGLDRTAALEARAAVSRRDADTLLTALLGAATEAAGGRAAAAALPALVTGQARIRRDLDGVRGAARWLADLAAEAGGGVTPARLDGRRANLEDKAERLRDGVTEGTEALTALAPLLGAVAALPSENEPVTLRPLLVALATALGPRLAARGVNLSVSCPEDVPLGADASLVGAVVFYGIEAAALRVEAGPGSEGGAPVSVAVTVRSAPATAGGGVRLTISDDGPDLTDEARALLMDRERSGRADEADGTMSRGLAEALRVAPDAAAVLLADALTRAVTGRPLALWSDDDGGMTLVLDWPPAGSA